MINKEKLYFLDIDDNNCYSLSDRLNDAEERIRFLEEFIVNNGLEIPYPKVNNNEEEDWLPF